jgi:hypothetical protein
MKHSAHDKRNTTRRSVMRITIRRVAGLVAVAAGPLLAACDPAKSAAPGIEPATGVARSTAEVQAPGDGTRRSCPEVRIPELPCLSGGLPDTVKVP